MLGKKGEEIAVEFLKKKGYKILERNFIFQLPHSRQKGEIDIIAKKGEKIFFIEVKSQKGEKEISPEEKVNFSKAKKLIDCAEYFLSKNKITLDIPWQIDVISVHFLENGKTKIFHFENAIPDWR